MIHSYRHRFGAVAGDPRYDATEAKLAGLPKIAVPAIALHGAVGDVMPAKMSERHAQYFTASYERRLLANVGHNVPQEAPRDFAQAILDLCK